MIEFTFENETEILANLTSVTPSIVRELTDAILLLSEELAAYIQNEKLSGQVLNEVTGDLKRSVHADPVLSSDSALIGSVVQDRDIAPYGFIHEYGGAIPGRSGLMAWIGRSGENVVRRFARGFDLPEKSFMRSALEDFAPQIEQNIILAVAKGIGE